MGIGGAETHILTLASELASMGHSVTVMARRGALCPLLAARGVAFVAACGRAAADLQTLMKLIRKGGFDVVHAHSRPAALAVWAARRALPTMRFGFTVTAHASYRRHPIKDAMSVWGDECIAVSDDIRDMLTSVYGLPRGKVTVIPNGVDVSAPRSRERNNGRFDLLFASRLDRDCSLGADTLCDIAPSICRIIPNLRITLVGGGDRLPRLQLRGAAVNRACGRELIRVAGAVTDMRGVISDCDCAVGVSRFALEAAAMGKNVILFGNEGALGLLEPSVWDSAAGTNFTARGSGIGGGKMLEREILRLWRMSGEERARISDYCRSRIVDNYSSRAMAAATLAVYNRCLPRRELLLGGYYGYGNVGDETVCTILKRDLANALPDFRIRVLTASPRNEGDVRRTSLRETVSALNRAEVYVSGGGSLFQNATSLRSLAYYCGMISLARAMGCRVAVLSGGIGPLRGRIAERMVGVALSKCDYISMRDRDSQTLAISLVRVKKRIALSADPAFSVSVAAHHRSDTVRRIACSFRKEEVCESAAADLLSKRLCAERVDVAVDLDSSVVGLRPPRDLTKLSKCLEGCDAAVGSRLHFLILALLSRVCFVPVGTDPKLVAFSMMTLGVPPINVSSLADANSAAEKMAGYIELCRGFYDSGNADRVTEDCIRLYKRDILSASRMIGQKNPSK